MAGGAGAGTRTERISLGTRTGPLPVLVATSEKEGPRPAVVIGAEAYGLNTFTHEVAARLAAAGAVVLVPDYYRGESLAKPDDYSDFTEVIGFIDRLDFVRGAHDLLAAVEHARSLPEVDPARVVVWGYCTGATLALLAACLDRQLAGAVLFFPSQPTFDELTAHRPVHPIDLLWNVACPMLWLYGDEDPVLVPVMPEVERRLDQWGVEHDVRVYPGAGHAFSAPDPPLRNAVADEASWADATAFAARVTDGGIAAATPGGGG